MPRVNIWIRKEDEKQWNAIEDKPAWIHSVLNGNVLAIESISKILNESGAIVAVDTLRDLVKYFDDLEKHKNGRPN